MECPCTQDELNPVSTPDTDSINHEEPTFEHITSSLMFEPTVIGTVAKKTFIIMNDSTEDQMYVAQRDPNTNPIYHAFDFKIAKTTVPSGEQLECIVKYRPQVVHDKNVDYIQIVDNYFRLYRICLQGECIGPSASTSISSLYFYYSNDGHRLTNTFEIMNTSNIQITFQFDKNEDNRDVFVVDKLRGVLQPLKHTYVTVRFNYTRIGTYRESLACLILNHEPIIIELIGVYTRDPAFKARNPQLKRYLPTIDETKGYKGYMFDSVKMTIQKPPFSLSEIFSDFGSVKYDTKVFRTLVTSLTNHLESDIEIFWENDSKGNFVITPQVITVPSRESVLYECQFRPDNADQLYTKLLSGCVHWIDTRESIKEEQFLETIYVPLPVTLRALGHTFLENKEWLPLVEVVPSVIILPPCIPMSSSYTTFMLQSTGHLPASFKFIPPKKTHFLLKPMVGIIYGFQIVIAQLQADMNNKQAYVERWGLELNGRTKNCLPVYLKGYSEYPSIIIGNNNVVSFTAVQPGCQDIAYVVLKNASVHVLTYNFKLNEDSCFSIDHPKGQLASNESVILQWYSIGSLNSPESSTIKCEIQTVQKVKLVTGVPFGTSVKVHTKCIYSQLCVRESTPNSHDFGEILHKSTHTTEFYLFNFGQSPIHFKLLTNNFEDDEQVRLVPSQGTVAPNEKVTVILNLTAIKARTQEIQIIYQLRLHSESDIIINDKFYNIFLIKFNSVYPTLQIEDLSANNFCFLFTKLSLWQMFKIQEINKILEEIEEDQTKSITISVPDYELGDEEFFATFSMKNTSKFPMEVALKRKKLCFCNRVALSKGLSLRGTAYDCIHRDMFKLTFSNNIIDGQSLTTLRMDVKYLEHGSTNMMYTIDLSHNRKLDFCIVINVLPEITIIASNYGGNWTFNLKSVFIGESEPPAQTFPLYNNSQFMIEYELDSVPLEKINFDFGFEIFKCINPKDIIMPFTSTNIVIKFVPIEVRTYKVTVPLRMGDNHVELKITGEGVLNYNFHAFDIDTTSMPCSSKSLYMENAVELSIDHLIIEPFPVWSNTEHMLFIRNHTPDRVIGYSWQTSTIGGIVTAQIVHPKGVLQPKESHVIIIRIESFDQPCQLQVGMICKLLDHTQHIMYAKSLVAHNRKKEELAGQFTITEDGIFYPENDVVIQPKPENFYTTLAISLCITSVRDMDLCFDAARQLQLSPQYNLPNDPNIILEKYFDSFVEKQLELSSGDLGVERNKSKLDKESVHGLKNVLECLISDTLFCEKFVEIIDISSNSPQPYYIQFKMSEACTQDKVNENDCLEKRIELIEDFINRPQTPLLANILKELITDGIHQVFQLGPQIKNKPTTGSTYYLAKNKFTCPSCGCNY